MAHPTWYPHFTSGRHWVRGPGGQRVGHFPTRFDALAYAARQQWDDAMLETINDDARAHSFSWISIQAASDGSRVMFGQVEGHMRWEPARSAA